MSELNVEKPKKPSVFERMGFDVPFLKKRLRETIIGTTGIGYMENSVRGGFISSCETVVILLVRWWIRLFILSVGAILVANFVFHVK